MKKVYLVLLLLAVSLFAEKESAVGEFHINGGIAKSYFTLMEKTNTSHVNPIVGFDYEFPLFYTFAKFKLGAEYSFRFNLYDTLNHKVQYGYDSVEVLTNYTNINGAFLRFYAGNTFELNKVILGYHVVFNLVRSNYNYIKTTTDLKEDSHIISKNDGSKGDGEFQVARPVLFIGYKHKRASWIVSWERHHEMSLLFRWALFRNTFKRYKVRTSI